MKQSPKYTNKGFIARNDSLPKMKATCVSRPAPGTVGMSTLEKVSG